MNTETLRAMMMDRELGELPPDVKELLDAYIEAVPASRAEAEAIARTISTTRETVRRYPELAPAGETQGEVRILPVFFWIARVAALITIVWLAGWLGYRTGQSNVPAAGPKILAAADPRFEGLWTKYQVAYNAHSGTFVVAQE